MSEQEKHLGEQGLSASSIFKCIVALVATLLVYGYFVAR